MSLALDYAAIRERFVIEWDDRVHTVFANEEAEDPDEADVFVRFSVNPGNRALYLGGQPPTYSQLGRIWLQIFTPKGMGTVDAYDLADQFKAIFNQWVSDDEAIRIYNVDTQSIPNGENGTFQLNVSIAYESLRRS